MEEQLKKRIDLFYKNNLERAVCRICVESLLSDNDGHHAIHQEYTVETDFGNFTVKPSEILGQIVQHEILPEEDQSSAVCQNCFQNLINTFIFKQECIRSDSMWLSVLKERQLINEQTKSTPKESRVEELYLVDPHYVEQNAEIDMLEGDDNDSEEEPVKAKLPQAYCKLCKKLFSTKKLVKIHFKRIHPTLLKNWLQYCSFNDLEEFIRKHDAMKKNYIPCSQCSSRFKDKRSLRSHICMKHPVKSTSQLKTVSIRIENPEFSFSTGNKLHCPHCKKSYNNGSSLNRHIKRVHLEILEEIIDDKNVIDESNVSTSNSKHLCRLCNKYYFSYPSFICHIKNLHADYYTGLMKDEGKRKELENKDPVTFNIFNRYCKICDKLFKGSYPYQRHVLIFHPELSNMFLDNKDQE